MITYGTEKLCCLAKKSLKIEQICLGVALSQPLTGSNHCTIFDKFIRLFTVPHTGKTLHLESELWIYEAGTNTQKAFIVWNRSDSELQTPNIVLESSSFKKGIQANGALSDLTSLPKVDPGISVLVFDSAQSTDSQTIDIVLKHPPLDGTLAIVGSDPALGGWDPTKAPTFKKGDDGLELHLSLPQYAVLSFKLVLLNDDTVQWENGDNRYLWLNTEKIFTLPKIQIY